MEAPRLQYLSEDTKQLLNRLRPKQEPTPLLQTLEMQLSARLAAIDGMAGKAGGWGRAKLRMDAHRHAFEGFIASTTVYRSLLLHIKAAYDEVLEDAVASAYDNIQLREKLSCMPTLMAVAETETRQQAEADAEAMENELRSQLAELQVRAGKVEGEASDAEDELRNYQKALNQAKRGAEQLSSGNQRTQAELLTASSWKGL